MKRKSGKISRVLTHLLAWALVSAILWSWVFTFLTDASRENKVVLYADMAEIRWKDLAVAMEEEMPAGIRLFQAHPFSYAMMNSADVELADLYIMTAAQAEERLDWLTAAPAGLADGRETLILGEETLGIRLDPAWAEWLSYGEQPGQPWYLFFGKESLHLSALPGAVDDAGEFFAERLLTPISTEE